MQPCTYMTPPQYIQHAHAPHPPPHPTHPFYPGGGVGGPPNFMVGCYQTNGWTGIPLISTAQRRPRRGVPISLSRTQSLGRFDEQSISRMAIHAHGAPLISIGGRYGNNNNRKPIKKDALRTLSLNEERSSFIMKHENSNVPDRGPIQGQDENSQTGVANATGCSTSETCLPRIIKPRKRRKKDRKPTVQNNTDGSQLGPSTRENEQSNCESILESSSNIGSNPTDINTCSCSCNLCDPLGRLWPITPLRRSCSDNSSDVVDEHRRTKDVGVIGGDRRVTNTRNEWRSLPVILHNSNSNKDTRKSSLSDSGDSGCAADILSGLNITDDLLAVGRELFTSTSDTNGEFQLAVSATNTNINNNNNHLNYGYNKYHQRSNNNNNDTVLNEKHIETNLNELTRKLSETLDLKSDEGQSSSDNVSVLSDSVFSDGVPDLFVNFDSISKNQLFSANNISQLSNLLFVDDNLTSPALVQIAPPPPPLQQPSAIHRQQSENNLTIFNNNLMNNNNNNYDNHNNNNNNNKNCINKNMNNDPRLVNHVDNRYDQPFIFIPDKDRSSEIFKCFDMVWNGLQQQN